MRSFRASWNLIPLLLLNTLPAGVLAGDVLTTDGFSTCVDNPTVQVQKLNIQYDRASGKVVFDVAGSSSEIQKVMASIVVTAYGKQVYQNSFNPCDNKTAVPQLCPIPAGNFSASGSQDIPSNYASMIPSIAFTVPDLDGEAKLELKSVDTGADLACIQSTVNNGKTMNVPAVSYVVVGMAGAALVFGAVSAAVGGAHAGSTSPSPTFSEVVGWFQGLAVNGMMSVQYPTVYRSFAKNFAFSTGLVPWGTMQTTIDNFRAKTGGNLTEDSYAYLQNATLVYTSSGNTSSIAKRALNSVLDVASLYMRDIETNINGTSASIGSGSSGNSTGNNTSAGESKEMHYVKNIQAYVEQLSIPQANTFMTVLLVFAIIVAAITVGILLFKVILEAFALMGKLPKSLESFRKRYWWRLAKTITNLILLLYGMWTLYCVYQFTNGDSWAAKTLAAVTWSIFTAVLGFFGFRIWFKVRQFRKMDGNTKGLYEDKETWVKYSLFYDNYKKGYWWVFVPAIIYMFARNVVIAAFNGHGLAQTIAQMSVEVIMLVVLLWSRPYSRKSGNVINIIIQVVRVLSVVCILVFVEELGISQTTKTVTGVVLIIVQSVLTGVLAILIVVNAIITCVKENPHRRKRKEAEKLNKDLDTLTPLDARNSLLMDPTQLTEYKGAYSSGPAMSKAPLVSSSLHNKQSSLGSAASFLRGNTSGRYEPVGGKGSESPGGYDHDIERSLSRPNFERDDSRDRLVDHAASFGGNRSRSPSREPRLPDVGFGRAY